MITSNKFDLIKYKYPNLSCQGKLIESLIGLDTEAYTSGKPFMVCLSTGENIEPEKFLDYASRPEHAGDYCAWNLKYDSGALIYHLPKDNKVELWEKTFTEYNGLHIEYIPHKSLFFYVKKNMKMRIWDILQYYKMPLDKASQIYLNDKKKDVETKQFTISYVKKHFKEIREYCVYDALLTQRLGMYLINKLSEFGVRTTALYSSASLSFRYFSDRTEICTSWRFWKHYRDSLKYAIDSYQGGKFEVTSRGHFSTVYEYDIVSAYPHEISRLVDISLAKVVKSRSYQEDSQYAAIRCKIYNKEGKYIPCGILFKGVRIYPSGEFYSTITKEEYDYLVSLDVEVKIIDAYWLCVRKKKYPYSKVISELFTLKSRYKGRDSMLYDVSKKMMNSFYGKTCQMIEDWKGFYNAGTGWNPFHAASITARTRIQVCKIQNLLKSKCIGVHTDSVITLESLDDSILSNEMGGFLLETSGDGIIIACGQYQIGEKGAFKGFEPAKGDNWKKILEAMGKKSILPYPAVKVETWTDAVSKGHFDTINKFTNETKKIDINADIKRMWPNPMTGAKLLTSSQSSFPKIVVHLNSPEHWGNP